MSKNPTATIVVRDGKYYLPLTGLKLIIEDQMEHARELAEEYNVSIDDIGIDLDKFHTMTICAETDTLITLIVDDKWKLKKDAKISKDRPQD